MKRRIISLMQRVIAEIRFIILKFKGNDVDLGFRSCTPLSFRIQVSKNAKVAIGKRFIANKGSVVLVRGGVCTLGCRVSLGMRNIVNCHNSIIIGDNVNIAPDVKIYDHDHDFKNFSLESEEWRDHYLTGQIVIGSNVWIGANTIILRNTVIGDNCVIGAGCVLKGNYPSGSIITQERVTRIKDLND